MICRHDRQMFFLMNAAEIARYITRVLREWGLDVRRVNRSPHGSWYIKVGLGGKDAPRSIHIRVSDHNPASTSSLYDYDVLCAVMRDGAPGKAAISYIALIRKLSEALDRVMPPLCRALTMRRKALSLALQYNRKNASWRGGGLSRLYL